VAVFGCGGVGLSIVQGRAHRRARAGSSASTCSTGSSRWRSGSARPTSSTARTTIR
jgi:hypothetical protein